ncbi:hypothetical protein AWC02_00625 [Mycolicibacter engbaekii]|uniref:Uncharacterized protein n=1 Tax=Mycolicibacter engbaekii TaxID=188915 RepID=A0A1X1TQQ4_9MYCO|nr:hypothetical protein [Mycolicibacter engbaekii]ORV46914.1 hypothetical protein AWC02_00625 [Mycolicibacter engbaekii]
MATKRTAGARQADRGPAPEGTPRTGARRAGEAAQSRGPRRQRGTAPAPGRESRPRTGPQRAASLRPDARPVPPKNTKQAKARAKARKAKAPKVVRVPLRERLIARLASVDLRPRTLAAKVPFVVLVIGALGIGLGITLWLSTDAAERSYELGNIRERNRVLLLQKEALERDVLTAESAPALAEAARELGMIPSRDTAHLVQDPVGNWVVVGVPKPAEGAPPPPLNVKLPDDTAPPAEVPVRLPFTEPKPDSRHLRGGFPPAAVTPGAPLTIPGLPGAPGTPVRGPLPGPSAQEMPHLSTPAVPTAGVPPVLLPPGTAVPPETVVPLERPVAPTVVPPAGAGVPPLPALAPERVVAPVSTGVVR